MIARGSPLSATLICGANKAKVESGHIDTIPSSANERSTLSAAEKNDSLKRHWDLSRRAEMRLENKIEVVSGVQYYLGRRVIERDTPILEGVSISAGREAIVVSESPWLRSFYDKVVRKASAGGPITETKILEAIYETVREHFVDRNRVPEFKIGRKVSLDMFIDMRAGVCRHKGLTCAAMMEMAQKDGYLHGKISFDRNFLGGNFAHAWARYTSQDGQVYILDAMQGFFGPLNQAPGQSIWDYRRPEDIRHPGDVVSPSPLNAIPAEKPAPQAFLKNSALDFLLDIARGKAHPRDINRIHQLGLTVEEWDKLISHLFRI